MMFFSNAMLYLFDWIASRVAIDLDPPGGGACDSVDEREIIEQLHYGRD